MSAVKLPKKLVSTLTDSVEVAGLLGINSIVLDGHSVRGRHHEAGTIFVMNFDADTEWEFGAIGITRIPELSKRLNLMKTRGDDFTIEAELKTRGEDVTYAGRLTLKHAKTKVEYKCGDPTLIKAPKGLADEEYFTCALTRDDIKFIKSANSAMGADKLIFSNPKDTDNFVISIPNKEDEKVVHETDGVVGYLSDATSFSFAYDSKILIMAINSMEKILRKDDLDALEMKITRRGVLTFPVKGITTYIIPSP